MRISLCNEVLAGRSFAQQCDLAARLGYDGLEVAPFTLGDEPWTLPAGERAALRRAAADAGIAIPSLHALLYVPKGLSITTADDALRARTVEIMRGLIGLAADLGARILVHGSAVSRELTPGDEAEGRRRGTDSLAAVARDAEAAGTVYCIEPLTPKQTPFVNTVEEAVAIVDEIGSPGVQTMIDCSAATQTETRPVTELIRTFVPGGRIAHIHFNDPNRRGPGEGALAFAPILAALKEVGYAGDSAVEPFIYEPDGPTCAARQIGYLRGAAEAATR